MENKENNIRFNDKLISIECARCSKKFDVYDGDKLREALRLCDDCIENFTEFFDQKYREKLFEKKNLQLDMLTKFISSSSYLMNCDYDVTIQTCFNMFVAGSKVLAKHDPDKLEQLFDEAIEVMEREIEKLRQNVENKPKEFKENVPNVFGRDIDSEIGKIFDNIIDTLGIKVSVEMRDQKDNNIKNDTKKEDIKKDEMIDIDYRDKEKEINKDKYKKINVE